MKLGFFVFILQTSYAVWGTHIAAQLPLLFSLPSFITALLHSLIRAPNHTVAISPLCSTATLSLSYLSP